jgi:hypothetical protein
LRAFDGLGVFGAREELPPPALLHELDGVPVLGVVVVGAQLLQGRAHAVRAGRRVEDAQLRFGHGAGAREERRLKQPCERAHP